jgi:hypothetical protein
VTLVATSGATIHYTTDGTRRRRRQRCIRAIAVTRIDDPAMAVANGMADSGS